MRQISHGNQPRNSEASLKSNPVTTGIKLCIMSNERGLLAELRRHNLLRPLLRQRIIQEAVGDESR